MHVPKVSVILPCYNGDKFIRETLESALYQTYNDIEIIVVDDGSTDDSKAIIKSFSDPCIKYFYKENEGVSVARNHGIRFSKGKYIAFLDSDDLWLPEKIELQLKEIERQKDIYFVCSGFYLIDSRGQVLDKIKVKNSTNILKDLLLDGNIIGPPSSVLVKREVFKSIGDFDPFLSTSADWDLWIRIAQRYPLAYIDKPLIKYRIHEAGMHHNIRVFENDVSKTLYKFFNSLSLNDEFGTIRKRAMANAYMVIAKSYFKKGNLRNSEIISRATVLYPNSFRYAAANPGPQLQRQRTPPRVRRQESPAPSPALSQHRPHSSGD